MWIQCRLKCLSHRQYSHDLTGYASDLISLEFNIIPFHCMVCLEGSGGRRCCIVGLSYLLRDQTPSSESFSAEHQDAGVDEVEPD